MVIVQFWSKKLGTLSWRKYENEAAAETELAKLGFMPAGEAGAGKTGMDIWESGLYIARIRPGTEPVIHAHWKVAENQKGIQSAIIYQCSKCGRTIRIPWGNKANIIAPYCHCGAVMDEGGEK